MISIVVATDRKGVIGREDKIPWRLRDDLVALRKLTKGHTVIMGRKTYESMVWYYDKSGKPMPGKIYLVATRNADYQPVRDNARAVTSIDEALAVANDLGDDQIFVLGGGAIFSQMLPYTDRIYLTEVHTDAEGDAYFPKLNPAEWQEVSREYHQQDARNEYDYDVVVLERK